MQGFQDLGAPRLNEMISHMGANCFGFVVVWLLARRPGPCCGGGWVAGKESPHQKKFQPTKLALDSSGVVCFKIVFMNCHCFGVALYLILCDSERNGLFLCLVARCISIFFPRLVLNMIRFDDYKESVVISVACSGKQKAQVICETNLGRAIRV